jgi:NAD(P)-dependent dehydrogenase (short-subunit alcohol dehydrogenase family)
LETNFWGCVRVVQQVLPAMRAQGGGRIVLISSVSGVIGIPLEAFSSTSKFAREGLGEALAYEVAPFGMQVTLVEPANVKTGISRRKVTSSALSVRATSQVPYRRSTLPRSREKLSLQQLALHGLGGPVGDLARSQPHPAVDALPQQVGVADVAGILLDHVDQHLP